MRLFQSPLPAFLPSPYLLLLLVCFCPVPCLSIPQYFSTLSTNVSFSDPPIAVPLPLADDAPLLTVALSFVFPFYQPASYLYIDPNGAIHLQSPTPPCCEYAPSRPSSVLPPVPIACDFQTPAVLASFFNISVCTVDTSVGYSNLIMPFLTDLDPSAGGSVSYSDSGSELVLRWQQVPWWRYNTSSPAALFSFSVTLYDDGSIRFDYDDVLLPIGFLEYTAPSDPPIPRTLLVGVRDLFGLNTETANMQQYNTSRNGVYPPLSWVQSGNAITFCPLDTGLCLFPASGPLSGSQLVSLTSSSMVCASRYNHSYDVLFTLQSSGVQLRMPAVWDAESGSLQFITSPVTEADTAVVSVLDLTSNATVALSSPLFFFYTTASPSSFPRWTLPEMCDSCGQLNSAVCTADCNGTYFGTATLDLCSQCTGGETGLLPNSAMDCTGTCNGISGLSNDSRSLAQCLCAQLSYAPVVTTQQWEAAAGQGFGQYVGPVSFFVNRWGFDATTCGLSNAPASLLSSLSPLNSYQLFVLVATASVLLLSVAQAASVGMKRRLMRDPYHPSLFAQPGSSAGSAASAAPSVVVVQQDVAAAQEENGAQSMSEAELRRRAQDVRLQRQDRDRGQRDTGQGDIAQSGDEWRRRQLRLTAAGGRDREEMRDAEAVSAMELQPRRDEDDDMKQQ